MKIRGALASLFINCIRVGQFQNERTEHNPDATETAKSLILKERVGRFSGGSYPLSHIGYGSAVMRTLENGWR